MADQERKIVHRELDTDRETPSTEIAEIVAELEGKPIEELHTTWDCIDNITEHIFSNPPSPEAQVRIAFSYEGYRITVEQNGSAEFVRVA